MNDIKSILNTLDIENLTDDPKIKTVITLLLNIIEVQASEIDSLKISLQKAHDEINILKGEQKNPKFKSLKTKENISSETERKNFNKKIHKKTSKKNNLKIHETKIIKIDKSKLPVDAKFKGYSKKISQDIIIRSNNIEFKREVYYSPSENKTYLAELPKGYAGDFGPNLKSLIHTLNNYCNVSEPKILDFLNSVEIEISSGKISGILTKNLKEFHDEKQAIMTKSLELSEFQQIDDTMNKVNGENHHSFILCNDFTTLFFTREKKNRLTVLEILMAGEELKFTFNSETINLLKTMNVSNKIIEICFNLKNNNNYSKLEFEKILKSNFKNLGRNNQFRIFEACGISYYHKQTKIPVINILMADDAPQFKLLSLNLILCWIHDARHYKKDLKPILKYHLTLKNEFLNKYWDFYSKLLDFKKNPDKTLIKSLKEKYTEIFSIKTGYDELDKRIEKTKLKEKELLLVLNYPEIPLHNNASELGARIKVRKRDVSLQNKNLNGLEAQDTMLSIIHTCKKVEISPFKYIFEKISGKLEKGNLLPEIIEQKFAQKSISMKN